MTTFTTTAQPENGAIQLAITTLETVASITRSDANGVADVRTLPGLLPWTAPRVEAKRNKATNSWPASADGGGWGTSSIYTKAYVTGSTAGRTKCMVYTNTGTGTSVTYGRRAGMYGSGTSSTAPTNTTEVATVKPGEVVNAQLDLGTDTANTQGQLTLRWFGPTFADLGTKTMTPVDMQVNSHQTLTTQGTAPAGAAYYWLEWSVALKSGNTVGGEKAWASRCLLGPAGPMFDGGTADSDDFEYSWEGTPFQSDAIAMGPAGALIISDYEAASGAVSYNTVDDAGASDLTASTSWALTAPWVFVPVMPSYSVQLKTLLEYSAGGNSLGTVHTMLGRPDPVAVLRGMSTRSGSLRMYCGTYAEAWALVQATQRGEVLMLRQPEHQGMDMYFTASSYGVPVLDTNGGKSVWGVDLGYVELARPVGDLSGSLGWTFASVATAAPTFAALRKKYATFQDLLLNKAK